MNDASVIPLVLLGLFGLALIIGTSIVALAVCGNRSVRALEARLRTNERDRSGATDTELHNFGPGLPRPNCWLAIKGRNPGAIQTAMRLHDPRPCTWTEGLIAGSSLFIAPPVNGWILILGPGLPEPWDDVDACFRFVLGLSRKLGDVQFFGVDRVLNHHAWVHAHRGRIVRAYCWAGKTLWTQGLCTAAERQLGIICFDYAEMSSSEFCYSEIVAANADKVPRLAARWSLDPATVDLRLVENVRGIAGEPSRLF